MIIFLPSDYLLPSRKGANQLNAVIFQQPHKAERSTQHQMPETPLHLAHVGLHQRLDRIDSRHRKINWQYWPENSAPHKDVADSHNPLDDDPAENIEHISSRPDIEDEALIAWGLTQTRTTEDAEATLDVLHGEETNLGGCRPLIYAKFRD
jgi:hypothetical protein